MKKAFIAIALGVFLAMMVSSAYAGERFIAPTELIQYDPTMAYNGYTLFNPLSGKTAYLIDMEGNVVHTWVTDYLPGLYPYFLNDGSGNILRGAQDPACTAADTYNVLSGPRVGRLQEIDWDGNVVWDHTHISQDSISHHDFRRIWNAKLGAYTNIHLSFERMTADDAVALGCDPKYEANYTGASESTATNPKNGWSLDGIYEADMDHNIIWKWSFEDHLCQSYDSTKAGYVTDTSAHPEKLDINWLTPYGGPNPDWTHCNSLDYNQDLGLICVNAKHMSEFYVIDHDNTFVAGDPTQSIANAAGSGGDFMYRWGNPSVYGQGDPPGYLTEGHQQMYGAHNIQWIGGANSPWAASELSGGGNFLIFDNGCWCPTGYHSEVIEINPYLDASGNNTGSYVNPPDAGYGSAPGGTARDTSLSNQVAWYFKSTNVMSFYAQHISGAQRLPNGNTLIMSGTTGHMFEVTADKQVVWEYQNPERSGIAYETFQTDANSGQFSVFRCYRYGPDFPGLAGKDLTSQGRITGVSDKFMWHSFN